MNGNRPFQKMACFTRGYHNELARPRMKCTLGIEFHQKGPICYHLLFYDAGFKFFHICHLITLSVIIGTPDILSLLFVQRYESRDGPVPGALDLIREIATRQLVSFPVIADTFAAFTFFRTGIRTIAVLQISFQVTFHNFT